MKKILFCLLFALSSKASIIDPPRPQPTIKEQAKLNVNTSVKRSAINLFSTIKDQLMAEFNLIWNNRDALSPQETWAALGTDQCQAHQRYIQLMRAMNELQPDAVKADPVPVQEVGDGDQCVIVLPPNPDPSPSPTPGKPGK